MKALKTTALIALTTVTFTALSGCSVLDKFRKVQDDFLYDTVGMSSDDPEYDSLRSLLKDELYGVDRAKLELILDNKLLPSKRSSDMLGSALNVLHLYSYQESDCNVIFEFDADDKFNMFRQLTPELCATEYATINGKKGNAFQSTLARQAWEQAHAYKAGSCRILKDAVSRFMDKGGNKLSLEEIKAYLAEDAATKAQSEDKNQETSSDDTNSADVKNTDIKSVDNKDLKEAVNNLEEVKALIRQTMAESQNAKQ